MMSNAGAGRTSGAEIFTSGMTGAADGAETRGAEGGMDSDVVAGGGSIGSNDMGATGTRAGSSGISGEG